METTVSSNGRREKHSIQPHLQSNTTAPTYLNGPDQVLPASSSFTTSATDRVKLCIEQSGCGAYEPISVPGMLRKTAEEYPNNLALAFKQQNNEWHFISFKEYEETVRICAKGFLKLGLQRYHSVCIIGFNAPEWCFSCLGAIYAGGLSVGLYTTNSAETCLYCADYCQADIIVVENKLQLDKFLKIKGKLKNLKAIVQYDGTPEVDGVLSWEQLMKIGREEPDTTLNNVLKTICINECCSIIFTSGTVGMPKAAMMSHDNLTWNAATVFEYGQLKDGESVVSYLPFGHLAGQLIDIYMGIRGAITVYFADKDALKGSLIKTLQEVRPTQFFAVPRIWEKICEKMQKIGSESSMVKAAISSWAKYHGLQHYLNKMNGIESNTFSYLLARALVFSQVKKALGLDKCTGLWTGAAPLSPEVKKYFMSLDIPILETYGMTECSGSHIMGHMDNFKIEAVGKPRSGCYIKIANPDEEDQGEVCFKGRSVFMGYLNDPVKTAEAFDNENWLHSGDIGKIDKDGFLYITGRLKELVITAGGENVPPLLIEEEVKKQLPCISNAMLIGDRKKFLSILLTMKTEVNMDTGEPLDELTAETKQWCKKAGCEANTVKDVLQTLNEKFRDAIQKGINEANTKAISNAQKVQKFAILPYDFSIPTGELGPTMKLKRNVVAKKYETIIESLYQET